jgi:general secretion pathway protein D
VGQKLDVESIVSLQDEVTKKVGLEVSNIVKDVPVAGGGLAYQVGTRTTETTLALRDGETQILAGLINDDERTTFTKVPGLGDLPWIGRLFLSESRIRNKTEIALLITPRIVRNISRRGKSESEFHFGTENTVGPLPVTIGKVAPRSLAMSSRPGAVTLSGRESLAAARESRMASDESGSAPAPAPQEVGPSLFLNVPEQAAPGKDFSVSVGLTGAGSLPAAEFELGYDATQLETLDPSGTPGSRQLKLGKGGGAVDVRFRVIAQKPGTAEVSVRNLTLQAEAGESPPEVTLPPPVSIEIR